MSSLIEPVLRKLERLEKLNRENSSRKFGHNIWLERVLKGNGYRTFVEIGASRGDLTRHILSRVPLRKYFVVDPWCHYEGIGAGSYSKVTDDGWEKLYKSTLSLCRDSILQVFRLTSIEAAGMFEGMEFDCVFIDGDHSYEAVRADIVAWWPLVRKGGVLCGHDYSKRFSNDVVRAVDEAFNCHHTPQPHLCWGFRK